MVVFLVEGCGFEVGAVAIKRGSFGGGRGEGDFVEVVEAIVDGVEEALFFVGCGGPVFIFGHQ